MLDIQLKECSSWKWSRVGGWVAGEVMGHSQDAPSHGAYSVGERAPCGACTLTRHAQDGNDEAYWTCPTFTLGLHYLLGWRFKCRGHENARHSQLNGNFRMSIGQKLHPMNSKYSEQWHDIIYQNLRKLQSLLDSDVSPSPSIMGNL